MTTTQTIIAVGILCALLPILVRAVLAIIARNEADARLQRWRPQENHRAPLDGNRPP